MQQTSRNSCLTSGGVSMSYKRNLLSFGAKVRSLQIRTLPTISHSCQTVIHGESILQVAVIPSSTGWP